MNDKDWFKLFDETKETFKWFFLQYGYETVWEWIMNARSEQNKKMMLRYMNRVWVELPDNRFNIMENPKGWNEFLKLIEV